MVLYRYYNFNYAGSGLIRLETFKVLRETPAGYWIDDYGKEKWVGKATYPCKRYAFVTKELAQKSFIARKKSQIKLLKNQLACATQALQEATEGRFEEEYEPANVDFLFNL